MAGTVSPLVCASHHPYDSEYLATNAVTLHGLAHTNCAGLKSFACGDHWHVGHHTAHESQLCKNDPEYQIAQERRHNGGRV